MVVSYYAVIDFFSRGFGYIGRFADSAAPSREVGGMVFEERKELFFRFNAILCQSINLVSSLPFELTNQQLRKTRSTHSIFIREHLNLFVRISFPQGSKESH